jgi:hypothetical protein
MYSNFITRQKEQSRDTIIVVQYLSTRVICLEVNKVVLMYTAMINDWYMVYTHA